MGEYRVAVDVAIGRRVIVSKKSIPFFARQDQVSSLFEKYMPYYTTKKKETMNERQSLTQSSETPKPVNEELINKRYVFWREDAALSSTTIIKKEEEDEERTGADESVKDCERTDIVTMDDKEEVLSPLLEREITYLHVETTKRSVCSLQPPDDTNTISLSALCYSVLAGKRFNGTYYAFLMSTNYGKKKDTNIGVSRYPIFSVIAHNNQARLNVPGVSSDDVRLFPVIYDKDTASAAPYWRLDTVLGPFFTKRAAENCCHKWVKKTRGTTSKQNKAFELVEELQCEIYSTRIPIDVPFERYLIDNNAPLSYIKACQTIKHESHFIVSALDDDAK